MKMYEIAAEYEKAFAEMVDAETGEIDEKAMQVMDSLNVDLKEKGLAVAAYIRNHDADVEALKSEEQRLATRRKQLESRMEWLKGYLLENMERCEISEIKSPYFTIKTQKCPPSVVMSDEKLLPQKYIRVKETVSVDRTMIRKDIVSGTEVPGAFLKYGKSLRIS